jgi:hexosaminidase
MTPLIAPWICRTAWLLVLAAAGPASAAMAEPELVPRPNRIDLEQGRFEFDGVLRVREVAEGEIRTVVTTFAERAARACGLRVAVVDADSAVASVEFRLRGRARVPSDERYRLRATPGRIRVQAADTAGLRHGATTLLQLACASPSVGIPALRIDDAPRLAWRGVMLDSARHYQSPAYIRRFLDAMALHKLNVLHWHLTDDQAWRLEIKRYPRLTEIGAWRVPAGAAAAADRDPRTGEPNRIGGFYRQDDVREIVAYAARLGIQIVPEIEMPGHASAALAAYPQFGARAGAVDRVPADWGIYPNAFGLDAGSLEFLENVLTETMALFPSEFIHVGGDEVDAAQWQDSEAGRALAGKLGSDDPKALQAHFTEHMARFLADHGRRLVGWDEILTQGLARNAVVMSWRGIDGAIGAARQGHDTVLSAWPTLYFDNRQSDADDEPPGRLRVVSLRDVYSFDPLPATLDLAQRRRVVGVQGNVWTEHIRTEARVDHMTFPRAAAIAELGWTSADRRAWEGFARRLTTLLPIYRQLGLAYADSAFAARADIDWLDDQRARVSLTQQAGVGDLRYTLDGSEPAPESRLYTEPLLLPASTVLRAASFLGQRRLANSRRYALSASDRRRRDAASLERCSDHIALNLEDDAPIGGPRAVFAVDIQNPCWQWRGAPLRGSAAVRAEVGQVPFNFQIGAAADAIRFAEPAGTTPELQVRRGGCEGEVLVRLSLESALASQATTVLPPAPLSAATDDSDLCLRFAQHGLNPLWVLRSVELVAP